MNNINQTDKKVLKWFFDIATAITAGIIVAVGFHYFIIYNGFVPGGVNGIATMLYALTKLNTGYFTIMLNLPIYILVFFLVKRKTGIILTIYVISQSLTLILLELLNVPYYETDINFLIAALGGGVISGVGFGLMLRRFGASGGTYAIAALLRRKNPSASIVWLSFAMDSSVVVISFFVFSFNIEAAICTFTNLFIANKVAEVILQGVKTGYKYEIVTESPDELSQELIETLNSTVTRLPAQGMYTGESKSLLVCIIRKRHVGEFHQILKKYPKTFVFISKVNEVMGGKL